MTATVSPETEHQAIAFRNKDGSTKGHFCYAVTHKVRVTRCVQFSSPTEVEQSIRREVLESTQRAHASCQKPFCINTREIPFCPSMTTASCFAPYKLMRLRRLLCSPLFLRHTRKRTQVFNNELPLYSVQLIAKHEALVRNVICNIVSTLTEKSVTK